MSVRTPEQSRACYLKNRERIIAQSSAWAKANPEKRRAIEKKWREENRYRDTALKSDWRRKNKEKAAAHKAVAHAVKMGRLTRLPCIVCGDAKSQAHHEDYGKPLEVVWYCARHHHDRHLELKT